MEAFAETYSYGEPKTSLKCKFLASSTAPFQPGLDSPGLPHPLDSRARVRFPRKRSRWWISGCLRWSTGPTGTKAGKHLQQVSQVQGHQHGCHSDTLGCSRGHRAPSPASVGSSSNSIHSWQFTLLSSSWEMPSCWAPPTFILTSEPRLFYMPLCHAEPTENKNLMGLATNSNTKQPSQAQVPSQALP